MPRHRTTASVPPSAAGRDKRRSKSPDERDKCLKACFHLEVQAIEEQLQEVKVLPHDAPQVELEGKRLKLARRELTSIRDKFEKSNWAWWAMRPSPYRQGDTIKRHPSDTGHATDKDLVDHAEQAEALECMALLNFTRWLCGLEPVIMRPELYSVCDMVGQVLLPRAPSARASENLVVMSNFVNDLAGFLKEGHGHVAVLHCEASLVAAVHQSLVSTHLIDELIEVPSADSQRRAAVALAERVRSRARDRTSQDENARSRVNFRSALVLPGSVKETVTAATVPEPLKHLRLLWELDEREGAEPAEVAPRQASRVGAPAEPWPGAGQGRARKQAKASASGQARALPDPSADGEPPGAAASMWGDQRGALSFRRFLLNPALTEFGAGRSRDTCVLWTGVDSAEEQWRRKRGHPDAVCYPPPGIVPLPLLAGCRTPWSIMPDSARFQPTTETRVAAWRVRIERPGGGRAWTAERLGELLVRSQAVDCSARGEPFCVFFWPDISLTQATRGEQVEVVLSGLRGPAAQLTFFYDIQQVHQEALDSSLCAQAASLRTLLGDFSLWNCDADPPRPPSSLKDVVDSAGLPGNRGSQSSPVEKQPLVDDEGMWSRPPPVELMSHKSTVIVTNVVDLVITLRCDRIAALRADLIIMRYGGDEEIAPRATQVQKLQGSVFLIRIKLPMSRCRYQLRFQASPMEAPENLQDVQEPRYTITAGDQCQTLLSSMEDPFLKKFGLAQVQSAAHQHGVVVLAPLAHRIILGETYFLVYVDKEVALATALASLRKTGSQDGSPANARKESQESTKQPPGSSPLVVRGAPSRKTPGAPQENQAPRCAPPPTATTLFSQRLLPARKGSKTHFAEHPAQSSAQAAPPVLNPGPQPPKLAELHGRLREHIEPLAQDSGSPLHLDLMMHEGADVHRLHERHDFPGFFEGSFAFADTENMTAVRMLIRFPSLHAVAYCPKEVVEWMVCRPEHFPMNF